MSVQLNPQFMSFLDKYPDVLAKLLKIAEEWYKLQGEIPATDDASGPEEFEIGGKTELRTKGISHEELDAIAKGYAEATVKENAINYLKGFLAGILVFG